MRVVNIADLKNNLSKYLNEVRQGEELLVKDRKKPIARIVPLETIDEEAELSELIAEGLVIPPRKPGKLPESFWKEPLPEADIDVIALIREDRDAR
jgi:prevent-host-death family protein